MRIAPTSVVAVMAWDDEALCRTLTVVAELHPASTAHPKGHRENAGPGAQHAAHSSKRPPRYLARKRSAAA
jgi:hypothetical protein